MSTTGAGKLGAGTGGDAATGRHPWHPPQAVEGDPIAEGKLLINNTLTGRKDVFVPLNGREVRWYCCGPTVYDTAHVGHARSYLTFDIMRRILSDYFNYSVLYHINITDIDDKIILGARRNELIKRLEADSSVDFDKLVAIADEAIEAARAKAAETTAALEAQAAEAAANNNSRAATEAEELLKIQGQKQENLDKAVAAIEAAKADPARSRATLLAKAKSVIAEKLDREQGAGITDHKIFDAHARHYEREFMEDMAALGIREPDVLTRVTEYIPHIIEFVQKIVTKGMAYESNGSVYLSLEKFKSEHNYRKLKPASEDTTDAELEESEGALGDSNAQGKQHKNDFVLWKASKPGEPAWESPWGMGRPGWHIECSVIASDILGETLDLHSGGEDLKFPHHDNELAQSEACFGSQQWVNYFAHTGHLHIKGLKMSKSLKNFVTIREALTEHSARQLRILFLLQGWDEQMSFSNQTVDDAKNKEKYFRNFFQEVEALSRQDYLDGVVSWQMGETDHGLAKALLTTQETVHRSLLDNFNTRDAMLAMLELVSQANVYMRTQDVKPAILLLRRIAMYLTYMLRVFGVIQGSDSFGFDSGAAEAGSGSRSQTVAPYVEALVAFREKIRAAALTAADKSDPAIRAVLEACDDVRDNALVEIGVRLEDRPDGTKWNLDDPEVLRKERAEKLEKERTARATKTKNLIAKLSKDLEKARSAMLDPAEMFKTEEFTAWDEEGLPTMQADGEPVSDAAKKKKKKLQAKQIKLREDIMAKNNCEPAELATKLEAEIAELEKSL